MDLSVRPDHSSNGDIDISATFACHRLRHGCPDSAAVGFAKIPDLGFGRRGKHVFARVTELRHYLRNLQLANPGKRVGNPGGHKLAGKRKEFTVLDHLVTDLFPKQGPVTGINTKLIVFDLLASDGIEFNAPNFFPASAFSPHS